ncbi:MAG TPA: helix-turn-helix domain-containing protein [Myxococcota bacterium]|nr:helix-turn-helix domain-containing protein [Myxococcota bacterium]
MLGTVSQPDAYVLTPCEVAARLRVSPRTVQQWRLKGRGPAFFRAGKHVRYALLDVEAWIAEQVQAASSERVAPKAVTRESL